MTDFHTLSADIREDVGKGASRRLRHAGRVPAVIYGGEKDPVALTLEHREVWHAAENEAFFSSILEIRVGDGRTQQVVIRDMQRHPFKPTIMHVDFMRVSAKEELRMSLPLHFVGEEQSPAGKEPGVVIQHQLTEVEISALPKDLPEFIEVDLSALEPGGAIMLADLNVPEGVTLLSLTEDEESNVMVANAVHISESQGSGAAAAAEAEAEAVEAAGEEAPEDADADAEAEDGDDAEAEDKE
ncbi:MAG: 50S ribosomal protein L25/general stress protein Ctc [Xanthomonadales bacterium]|jgi:large subunit ribosomal protein L25|nr:50S ribosomal protein L25/general stress protein Ctc [Xanthomonadales bacterium]